MGRDPRTTVARAATLREALVSRYRPAPGPSAVQIPLVRVAGALGSILAMSGHSGTDPTPPDSIRGRRGGGGGGSSLVFPLPEGPTRSVSSPPWMSSVTSSSARLAASPDA